MENNIPKIIFEDDKLLVLNKPAGLVVHSDGRTIEHSLVEWIEQHYPELTDIGGLHTLDSGRYTSRHGIVHRLDRETSGVILVAKESDCFFALQQQFISRMTSKVYYAFVIGVPTPKSGEINLPIGRGRKDFRQWETGENARGTLRQAITEYSVEKNNASYAYVRLSPKTGRTHQLRVHMKAIGHPIVCDSRYGTAQALDFTRVALHSSSLTLMIPHLGMQTFTAPLPDDFVHALKLID